MIGIVDYGMGNLGSVSNALAFLGVQHQIISRAPEMEACRAIILPGVGAFGDCMRHLDEHDFTPAVRAWIEKGAPFLGICLGLQVLAQSSEEAPGIPGFGLIPGAIRRFTPAPALKVPQIGWNRVRQARTDCPLFKGIPDQAYFYFVHSFYMECATPEARAGITTYGLEYASVVWRENLMAVQFHPEKSQKTGLQMLKNFVEWSIQ